MASDAGNGRNGKLSQILDDLNGAIEANLQRAKDRGLSGLDADEQMQRVEELKRLMTKVKDAIDALKFE